MAKKPKNNTDDILKQAGKALRRMRLEAGYSSYERFAYENNLSRIQYWRMESGSTNWTLDSLITVLNIHGVCYLTQWPKILRAAKNY